MTVKKCQLVISDEVNADFIGLDALTRRKCNESLKFFIHAARHTPAYRLGRWDGTVSFFGLSGHTYVNLLETVLPIITSAGYDIDLVDQRPMRNFAFPPIDVNYFVDYLANPVWPVGHPAAGKPILFRDYQTNIVQTFTENLQSMQEIATGAGKTLMTAGLSHLCEDYGRTMIIVPNKSLVEQTESDFKNLGLDVGVYFGDRKEPGHKHTICTWQSLDRMIKAEKAGATGVITIGEFIKDVICVIIDEAHQAKANVLKDLMCGPFAHIPIRWGLTGTIPKEDQDATSILASIGPVVNRLAASELQDQGVLANCHITVAQLQDTQEFDTFHEEYDYLVTDSDRLDWISEFIKARALTGNTLVLVNRVSTGTELQERIPNSTFISGASKGSDRKDAYAEAATVNDQILLATYGVAAVGINIPRIFNLLLIEPGKSPIRVIQSIGRGIRKAQDKDFVSIYDISSTAKFAARHLSSRKKTYAAANYPYHIEKVDYRTQLASNTVGLVKKRPTPKNPPV